MRSPSDLMQASEDYLAALEHGGWPSPPPVTGLWGASPLFPRPPVEEVRDPRTVKVGAWFFALAAACATRVRWRCPHVDGVLRGDLDERQLIVHLTPGTAVCDACLGSAPPPDDDPPAVCDLCDQPAKPLWDITFADLGPAIRVVGVACRSCQSFGSQAVSTPMNRAQRRAAEREARRWRR